METMPAFRLDPGSPPELTETVVPLPGTGQVRVRVAGCGLCHSDLSMMSVPGALAASLGWDRAFTLGHESAGRVDRCGPGVEGWPVGTAVAVASPTSCGSCRWCRRGQENACPHGRVGRGYGRDGGLAAYLLVDDLRALLPLGDLAPDTAGPLTDAGATSYHAVARVASRLGPGTLAVVFGVGGLGSFVVQILRAVTEARVIAVDPDEARRDVASQLGAHDVVDGVDATTVAVLADLVEGAKADAVVDLVGTDETIAAAVALLGPGGALALVGTAGGTLRQPWYGSLPPDGDVFTFQGSDLSDARAVIDLAATGRITVPVQPFALADVEAAYAALAAGTLTGRAVVAP